MPELTGSNNIAVTIFADDLTGACDTGVCFARTGWRTVVALTPASFASGIPSAQVIVVSTESRPTPVEFAVDATRRAVQRVLASRRPRLIYKKMDSTLRGHAGPELNAVAQACGAERILVAPAFPDQGRTTLGGRQFIHGQPLESTNFGAEVPCADLATLFEPHAGGRRLHRLSLGDVRADEGALVGLMAPGEPAVFIADAETNHDLSVLAAAALRAGVSLLCGSAGLARAVAPLLRPPDVPDESFLPSSDGRSVLILAGSRHPSTERQIEHAGQCGLAVLRVATDGTLNAGQDGIVEQAESLLASGRSLAVTTAGSPDCVQGAAGVAQYLAGVAAELLARAAVAGLVLTGGDIAAAVCAALDARWLVLEDEVMPGIPIGRLADGRRAGLRLVTKAGGFGGDDALMQAVNALAAQR